MLRKSFLLSSSLFTLLSLITLQPALATSGTSVWIKHKNESTQPVTITISKLSAASKIRVTHKDRKLGIGDQVILQPGDKTDEHFTGAPTSTVETFLPYSNLQSAGNVNYDIKLTNPTCTSTAKLNVRGNSHDASKLTINNHCCYEGRRRVTAYKRSGNHFTIKFHKLGDTSSKKCSSSSSSSSSSGS